MRILLDCDGVLSDFVGYVLDTIREQTGREYAPADVTQWDFGNLLVSETETRNLWAALKQPGVAQELRPIEGAAAAVEALRLTGQDLYVVTSPMPGCPTWAYERELWLRDHMGIERKRVIHTSAKHLVVGDMLVDDNADNVTSWHGSSRARSQPLHVAVLVDAPYNQHLKDPTVHRVPSITSVPALARRYA